MADDSSPTGYEIENAGIFVGEGGPIGGDNEIRARAERSICRKSEFNALGEVPPGDIRGNVVEVPQFDVAFEHIAGSGMIHNLADNNSSERGRSQERGRENKRPKNGQDI